MRSSRAQTKQQFGQPETDRKICRALFSFQNFSLVDSSLSCCVVEQISAAALQGSEVKDSSSYHGKNKKDCQGRAGRGRDSFVWFKTTTEKKEDTWQESKPWKNGLRRTDASWYWKRMVGPRHSFQKEAGQDLSNPRGSLYQREEMAPVWDWRLNSALLLQTARLDLLHLFFLSRFGVPMVLRDRGVQAKVMGAASRIWVLQFFLSGQVFSREPRSGVVHGSYWNQAEPEPVNPASKNAPDQCWTL